LTGIAALALALVETPVSQATITDDINPLGSIVRVSLSNVGGPASSGTVTIVADIGGANPYTKVVPFGIAADGYAEVNALFPAPVVSVVSVSITEGPDPIP
jgi:hypothetical protein